MELGNNRYCNLFCLYQIHAHSNSASLKSLGCIWNTVTMKIWPLIYTIWNTYFSGMVSNEKVPDPKSIRERELCPQCILQTDIPWCTLPRSPSSPFWGLWQQVLSHHAVRLRECINDSSSQLSVRERGAWQKYFPLAFLYILFLTFI